MYVLVVSGRSFGQFESNWSAKSSARGIEKVWTPSVNFTVRKTPKNTSRNPLHAYHGLSCSWNLHASTDLSLLLGWLLYSDPDITFRKIIEAHTYRGICFSSCLQRKEARSGVFCVCYGVVFCCEEQQIWGGR